jgi:hypothetical protein
MRGPGQERDGRLDRKAKEMAEFGALLTYAHENRNFVLFRLVAPFIVISLFLVAFIYGVEWQLRAEQSCSGQQGPCHVMKSAQNPGS